MPGVSPALCVGGSEGEGKGKAVEGGNVLAEAGRRGIARLMWRCEGCWCIVRLWSGRGSWDCVFEGEWYNGAY